VNSVTIQELAKEEGPMVRPWILGLAGGLAGLLALSSATAPAWAQGPWTCPAAESAKKNPVAKTPAAVAAGKKLTADKACTACHGESGKGDGPGAAALNPKPADWTSARVQQESDGCLFWKITTGRGAMPPWAALSETERWQLVHYLRTLKK
jgi:mono/diheme cytochrome c family protein